MSGHGAPSVDASEAGAALDPTVRIAVVAAQWHTEVMDGLLDGARRALREAGLRNVTELRVPGSFELPVAAARCVRAGCDGVVALGVVVRGGTPHFDYVCSGVTTGLVTLATDSGVPVGFGVLTCDDDDQARDRAGLPGSREDKGYEATAAVLATLAALDRAGV